MAIVLCYHHVNRQHGEFTSSPELFREHLQALRSSGFRFIGFEEFVAVAGRRFRDSRKSVLITTDDGHADNWFWAYPILHELRVPAVLFVITEKVVDGPVRPRSDQVSDPEDRKYWPGCDEGLTWAELLEMSGDGLVSVQSHTAYHSDFTPFVARPSELDQFVAFELEKSREVIERRTGAAPSGLAWPWGFGTRRMREIAARTGYTFQFSVVPGTNGRLTNNRFLHRYCCDGLSTTGLLRMTSLLATPLIGDVYSHARLGYNRLRTRIAVSRHPRLPDPSVANR